MVTPGGHVLGIGVDVVDVVRFAEVVRRTPGVVPRLFTPAEAAVHRVERLAARFAAKEAVAKALGCPPGLGWHDVETVTAGDGRPDVVLRGAAAAAASAAGARCWHLSLAHDAGVAVAYVLATGG